MQSLHKFYPPAMTYCLKNIKTCNHSANKLSPGSARDVVLIMKLLSRAITAQNFNASVQVLAKKSSNSAMGSLAIPGGSLCIPRGIPREKIWQPIGVRQEAPGTAQ